MSEQSSQKGAKAEEALRRYFLKQGYFVVRSVPFKYSGYDITDVDLWLYYRSAQMSRERINVDIKRKKTPQAIERIFWTRGLQKVLNLDSCIVATTDTRKETREFGERNGVSVLSGQFLNQIIKKYHSDETSRVSEEDLYEQLNISCITDGNITLKAEYIKNKQTLLDNLNFNGCNRYLSRINFLLNEHIASEEKRIPTLRLLYLSIAYFLVALDYVSKRIMQLDQNNRSRELSEGFKYGEAGRARAEEIVNTSMQLITKISGTNLFTGTNIESEIRDQLDKYPAETLSEHFSKNDVIKTLFHNAMEFEDVAFRTNLTNIRELKSEQRAILGILGDFFKIDRKKIL